MRKPSSATAWAVAGLLGIVMVLPVFSNVPSLTLRTADAATAPAHIQNNFVRIGAGNVVSTPFPGANAAGNAILVYALWSEVGSVAVSDTQGNVYNAVSAPTRWQSGAWSAAVLYSTNIKGGSNTVTATFSSSIRTFGILYIHEYSGINPASPIDGTRGAAGISATLNSGPIATTNANDLLFSAAGSDDSIWSAGPGYTVRSTGRGNMTADRNVSSTGQYTASGAHGGHAWVIQVVALRAASAQQANTSTPTPTSTPAPLGTATPTSTPQPLNTATPIPTKTSTPTRTPTLAPLSTATPTTTSSGAPPAIVQNNFFETASGNTVSVTFPSANTGGNAIVAYALWSETGSVTLSDSSGNTYAPASAVTQWSGNSYSAQVFYSSNIKGGGNTVTATFTSPISAFGILYIHEYSGIAQASPVDASRGAAGQSMNLDSGPITTTNPNDLLFSAAGSDDTVWGPGPGYTIRSTGQGNMTADWSVSSTGQYNASGAHSGHQWVIQVVALRAASTSTGPTQTPVATTTSTLTPVPTATPTQTVVGAATPTPTQTAVPTAAPTQTLVPTATPVGSGSGPAYPLKVSANGRYLVDQRGAPFLMAGDSPQSIINLSEADADYYFANRQADGFNTVWINMLCLTYTYCRSDGTTYDGIHPFISDIDLTTPNPAYFTRIDHLIQLAANHNLVVLLDPLETGGWLAIAQQNGAVKTNTYGKFVGNRYKNFPNIVWLHGNDFQSWWNVNDRAVIQAVSQGIQATDPNHLSTVELSYYQSGSLDDPSWTPLINMDAAYTYYPTYDRVLTEYNRASMPVFMVEANYEFEHNFTDQGTAEVLRRQTYWTLLSGATGQLYGNLYTVRFINGWKSNLDTPGARQLAYATNLFAPRQWYNLVPDQTHTVVTAGYGTYNPADSVGGSDYATAARTPDGRLVVVYLPSARTITVDMSKMSGATVARWYDPANGTFAAIAGSPLPNAGTHQFTSPGNNADGNADWVLVLEAP